MKLELFANCLPADIYKNQRGDCSNQGVSSTHAQVIVAFTATEDTTLECGGETLPVVRVVRRKIFATEYVHAEPNEPGPWMHGGTFLHSPDSRFGAAVHNGGYPIALHDRKE